MYDAVAYYWPPFEAASEAISLPEGGREPQAVLDDDWVMTAEELPCLLDMRVVRHAGRKLPALRGVVALGLPI
jgi:hypothetical protein